jgi:hypothetical protein
MMGPAREVLLRFPREESSIKFDPDLDLISEVLRCESRRRDEITAVFEQATRSLRAEAERFE